MTQYDGQPGRFSRHAALTPEQIESDKDDLGRGLGALYSLVAGARSLNVVLSDVAELAAQAIPGVDGVGMTVLHVSDGHLRVRAWEVTAPFVREIDILQYVVLNDGPCIVCMQERQPVVSGSLGTDARWPRFGDRVAGMGVNAALSLPLLIGDQVIGSINCYARERDAFGTHAVDLGSKFAGLAAVSVYNAQLLIGAQERAQHLQSVLDDRKMIDQAIGVIRGRSGVSVKEAFDQLCKISQSEKAEVEEIAHGIVEQAVQRVQTRHSKA